MDSWFQKLQRFALRKKALLSAQESKSSAASSSTSQPTPTPAAVSKVPGEDPYSLNREYQGSSRLNLQYFLWYNTLGFNLHPDIPPQSGTSCIADVATGTGIWLINLSERLPSTTQCIGFDVSLVQAPSQKWLPSNLHMHKWDIFKPPPAEFVGSFDVVHIRHVHLVIKDNDAVPIVKNLRALLKPNGYLQWDEVNPEAKYIERTDPSVPTPALENLFMKFSIPKGEGGAADWKDTLPATLNAHGFTDSVLHRYGPGPSSLRFWHDMYMQSWEEFITKIMGGLDSANVVGLINEAGKEVRSGAAIVFPMCIWVAKAV